MTAPSNKVQDSPKVQLLLLSSDLRRRYAEDILTALALPGESILQFRYGGAYVSPELQRAVADGSIRGAETTLAFVAEQTLDEPFLLPVRHAVVESATCVADTFFFQLKIGKYPSLADLPRPEADLRKRFQPFMQQLVTANGGNFYPATTNFPDLGVRDTGKSEDRWLGIAYRLAEHKTFRDSFFMRVDPPRKQDGSSLEFTHDGRLRLVDQQSARIAVSFYSESYRPDDGYTLSCRTDESFLRISSDNAYDVALRYDAVEFWVHPTNNSFDALAQISISMKAESPGFAGVAAPVPAYVRLPVVVQRSRSTLAIRAVTSGSGAVLVALPAILTTGAPLALRITLAVLGALLLALSSVVLNTTSR